MATVSGFLRFDKERTAVSSSSLAGIANVAIVLQDTGNNKFLAVNTNADGGYSFINVPDGNYRIVEVYGLSGVTSPADFSSAVVASTVSSAFPPISYANDPPPGTTNLDAVTPTSINITVSGADVSSQDILNGPVRYSPIQTIMDIGVVINPENLITEAHNGDFGSFNQGMSANSGVSPNPYPDIGAQFIYTQPNPLGVNPGGGQYTIQNTLNDATAAVQNTWWRVSDHTTGNETGRMMVINGDDPGKTIFEQKVSVKSDTYYLMSSWILNLSKSSDLVDPQLGVQVLDANGQIIYDATLGTLIPMDPNSPEWKQIGTVINSQSNTSLTLRFRSMGPEVVGNDYAIDDIALNEVEITAYSPVKSADKSVSRVGDIVTYTVTLTNTGANPLISPVIKDLIPSAMRFIAGTVTINGVLNAALDPNSGISTANVNAGETLTVTFQARAESVTDPNPTVNTASASYSYTPVNGGIPVDYNKKSNNVNVNILPPSADLQMLKTANKSTATEAGQVVYTLTVKNNGPSAAQNYTVTDLLPNGLSSPQYSLDNGATWQSWNGTLMRDSLAAGASSVLLLKANVSAVPPWPDLINTAKVSALTPDPNMNNNSSDVTLPVRSEADLSLTKTADLNVVNVGEMLTYTLAFSNNGPNAAKNVLITDKIPAALTQPEYSIDGGATWKPWSGNVFLGNIAVNASYTMLLRGKIDSSAYNTIDNSATISSDTFDPVKENNTSSTSSAIKTSADLSVTKTADKNTARAGELITYTLTIMNKGPNQARDIIMSDAIPTELTQAEYSFDGGASWFAWDSKATVDALAVNGSLIILLRAKVSNTAAADIVNTAVVTAKTPDPDMNDNTAAAKTAIILAPPVADVSLMKTVSPTRVIEGEEVTFTFVIKNNGPTKAENVVLRDKIAKAIKNPIFSEDGGETWEAWDGSLSLGDVAAGEEVTVLIKGKTAGNSVGYLMNSASVQSSTEDPNLGNNISTATLAIGRPCCRRSHGCCKNLRGKF